MTTAQSSDEIFDFAIIGAGIAGASLAFELSVGHKVLVIERESQPGYHTTGRSAALFSEIYGNATIRCLTRNSRAFFEKPPIGFSQEAILTPRGVLMVGNADQQENVKREAEHASTLSRSVREISGEAAHELAPILKKDWVTGAVYEPDAMDIDVHALHQGYLRSARANGALIALGCDIAALTFTDGAWKISTRDRSWRTKIVVNAAGAWADEIAATAGATPLGLAALRRTALLVDPPANAEIRSWPAVVDIDEKFYFKPDAGKLLLSPADETPSLPCDARPDELDIAICVDRIQNAADLEVRRVNHAWAGLRTFAPDRSPVLGFAPEIRNFFWLAGQGGYGIQTAPAMARAAAALLCGNMWPQELEVEGVTPTSLSPLRFCRN